MMAAAAGPLPHLKHEMEGAIIFHLFSSNEPLWIQPHKPLLEG